MLTSRDSRTIQVHAGASVPATSGTVTSATWIDCSGYDQISVTLMNDAGTNSFANVVWSNDATVNHGNETIIPTGNQAQKAGRVGVKARYAKVLIGNTDAAAHVMSAWAYLTT